jgi:arylsulfatase A-like enzyme
VLLVLGAALLGGGALLGGAGGRARRPAPGAPAAVPAAPAMPASAPVAPAAPAAAVTALLGEAARAELAVGGLVIDLGTPDQHKYTRGGWRTGWGAPRTVDGVTAAAVQARRARLGALLLDGEAPLAVAVRLRATAAGQRLALTLNGVGLGEQPVGAAWSTLTFPVPAAARRAGPAELTLDFAGEATAPAEVDTVVLRTGAATAAPLLGPRVMPLRLGAGARRSLLAPTPRRYSFYLAVPAQATLRFEYGARDPVQFVVRAHVDGRPARELFRAVAAPGAWRRAEVPLGQLGGLTARLDLATEGPDGVAGWAEPELLAPAPAPFAAGPRGAPARSAIVVVMDATRAGLFPAYDPRSPIDAPAFARLAGEGTLFEQAYANANWTKPSGATLITGLYQARHGVRSHRDRMAADLVQIGARLQRDGVRAAYFTANPQVGPTFGFGAGWDHARGYREVNPNAATWQVKPEPDEIFGDALAWIKAHRGERFYVHLHTMGAHAPYRSRAGCTERYRPAPYAGGLGAAVTPRQILGIVNGFTPLPAPADRAWIQALYQGEADWHDRALGRFVDELRAAGLLDTTLLVVTADHGEDTGEHELYGHGWSVHEEEARVPLLLRAPGLVPAGARAAAPAELVDVVPTILDALGLAPQPGLDGVSLLATLRGAPEANPGYALTEHTLGYPAYGLRRGRHTLMVVDEELQVPEPPPPPGARWLPARVVRPGTRLFDRATDPGEERPRADLPIARRALEVLLGEGLATPPKAQRAAGVAGGATFTSGRAVIDPALKRQLEALGYLGE